MFHHCVIRRLRCWGKSTGYGRREVTVGAVVAGHHGPRRGAYFVGVALERVRSGGQTRPSIRMRILAQAAPSGPVSSHTG